MMGMPATTALTDAQIRAWRGFSRMAVGVASRLHRRLVSDAGLSLPDYEVLSVLSEAESGTLRAFELGHELQWEKSRLSHHLKRMEGRGLVERVVCESDGRGLWISMTGAGRDAWQAGSQAHEDEIRRLLFDRIDETQTTELRDITEVVLDGLPDELCES